MVSIRKESAYKSALSSQYILKPFYQMSHLERKWMSYQIAHPKGLKQEARKNEYQTSKLLHMARA